MSHYKCVQCSFSTKIKQHYYRHLNTKKHERNIEENGMKTDKYNKMSTNEHKMSTNEHKMSKTDLDKYNCEYCCKEFSTHANKRRHEIHYCENNINITKEKELNYKKLYLDKEETENKYKNEIDKLHQKIEILLEKNTITNIFIDKQINLNSYGKEDLSHITSGFKDHLLKIPFVSISKMIEEVHFSDKKPENNNIMLPNKKEKYIKVYENDKWVFKDKKSTITNLVDNKYNIIDDHYEENVNNDDKQMPLHVEKQYENFRDLYNDGDKDLHTELRVDCELVLLNNR